MYKAKYVLFKNTETNRDNSEETRTQICVSTMTPGQTIKTWTVSVNPGRMIGISIVVSEIN